MPQFSAASLSFYRDGNGQAQMTCTVTYATGDTANGAPSGQFAQQVIADFFPQAMSDLIQGQKDDGDPGSGIK